MPHAAGTFRASHGTGAPFIVVKCRDRSSALVLENLCASALARVALAA
tara:strand:+ start:28177 stop:28320 length:144 start_codon:yes stop_codon:yes gene_type:complete